jgi:hypothetical protein
MSAAMFTLGGAVSQDRRPGRADQAAASVIVDRYLPLGIVRIHDHGWQA